MPRIRNGATGAIMSVSESTAARLGSEWAPADAVPETEPETAEAETKTESEEVPETEPETATSKGRARNTK